MSTRRVREVRRLVWRAVAAVCIVVAAGAVLMFVAFRDLQREVRSVVEAAGVSIEGCGDSVEEARREERDRFYQSQNELGKLLQETKLQGGMTRDRVKEVCEP